MFRWLSGDGLQTVLSKMKQPGDTRNPNPRLQSFHQKKYSVFKKMSEDQIMYRDIMHDKIYRKIRGQY